MGYVPFIVFAVLLCWPQWMRNLLAALRPPAVKRSKFAAGASSMGASKTWRNSGETLAANTWSGMMLRYLAIGVLALAWSVTAQLCNASAADDPKSFVLSIGDQVIKVLQQNLPREKVGPQLNAIWLQAFRRRGDRPRRAGQELE
jgi:hypothetical protein